VAATASPAESASNCGDHRLAERENFLQRQRIQSSDRRG
jgi:hypothetical protein